MPAQSSRPPAKRRPATAALYASAKRRVQTRLEKEAPKTRTTSATSKVKSPSQTRTTGKVTPPGKGKKTPSHTQTTAKAVKTVSAEAVKHPAPVITTPGWDESGPMISPDWWDEARAALSKSCPILRRLMPQYGQARLQTRGDAFITLTRSVVGQQLSVKAAATIWSRVLDAMQGSTAQHLLALDDATLRGCGLSERKMSYLRNIAQTFADQPDFMARLRSASDHDIIAELTRMRGIGVWTAEMFLIFHMLRPNVTPLDDLGLLKAISLNYFSGEPTSRAEAREICASWEPWGTLGTWYMWRSLDPIPVSY